MLDIGQHEKLSNRYLHSILRTRILRNYPLIKKGSASTFSCENPANALATKADDYPKTRLRGELMYGPSNQGQYTAEIQRNYQDKEVIKCWHLDHFNMSLISKGLGNFGRVFDRKLGK